MTIAQESRPTRNSRAAFTSEQYAYQRTPITVPEPTEAARSATPARLPLNLPLRVDVQRLDALELFTVAALFAVTPDQARATIATLRGSDFRSPVLEHIVRAVQRTAWEGQPVTPATVTDTAVRVGLIRQSQQVELERACHDVIDAGMGAVGQFETPLVIYQGTLRAVSALAVRCQQSAEVFHVSRPTDGITAAPQLANTLRAIAADASALADRLDAEVAPR